MPSFIHLQPIQHPGDKHLDFKRLDIAHLITKNVFERHRVILLPRQKMSQGLDVQTDQILFESVCPSIGSIESHTDLLIEDALLRISFMRLHASGGQLHGQLLITEVPMKHSVLLVVALVPLNAGLHAVVGELLGLGVLLHVNRYIIFYS